MMKVLLVLLLLFSCISPAYALYADIEFHVANSGEVTIKGISNHEDFQNSSINISSHTGSVWLLNYSSKESFDSYIYTIYLPKNAQITYLKTAPSVRIGSMDGPFIKVIGNNEPLYFTIQYAVEDTSTAQWALLGGGAFLFIIAALILYFLRKKKLVKTYDVNTLSDRQRDIIQLIEKKPRSQKELEEILHLPKSSISRNVDSLVKQNIIEKHKKGMSNKLQIKRVPPSSG